MINILNIYTELYTRLDKERPDISRFHTYENYRLEHAIFKDGSSASIPIVDVITKDKGAIPILPFDVPYPTLRNWVLSNISSLSGGLAVTETGLPERVIMLDRLTGSTDKQKLASVGLKRFARYLPDNYKLFGNVYRGDCLFYMQENDKRWFDRIGQPYSENDRVGRFQLSLDLKHRFMIYQDDFGSSLLEYVIEDIESGKVLHWVNTYRKDSEKADKGRHGNNALLALILFASNIGCSVFNMGIDTFDYKNLWSSTVVFAKGLEYVGS